MSGSAQKPAPVSPVVWVAVAVLVLVVSFPTLVKLPAAWPPAFIERRAQRSEVVKRIESAGGWEALRRDCDALVERQNDTYFYWFRKDTNALPPSIAALKPMEVRALAHRNTGERIVHIKVFGFRSTDGHQPPYFGLEVVTGFGAENYSPEKSRFVDLPCVPIATGIYEVHR